ncbi:MAG: hypothetical protein LC100_15070 [Chitinophagales bacterium]|nr:hypothetical protein [Chitinophagales bacterium]
MKTLEGMLVYCMLHQATPCYDKEKGTEWKCGVVVDEDTADAFAEIYAKQPARKVKRTEFKEIYKCDPPEGSEKNLYVITLKKNTHLANKEPVPDKYKPRVFEQVGKTLVDITETKLPANGSYGAISIDHYENSFGASARLKNVKVTSLIEFKRSESNYQPGDEFDSADDGNGGTVVVPAKAKTSAKSSKKVEEDSDSDSPF